MPNLRNYKVSLTVSAEDEEDPRKRRVLLAQKTYDHIDGFSMSEDIEYMEACDQGTLIMDKVPHALHFHMSFIQRLQQGSNS